MSSQQIQVLVIIINIKEYKKVKGDSKSLNVFLKKEKFN